MIARIVACVALVSASTAALAADMSTGTGSSLNWSGFYAGAQIGYDVGGRAEYTYFQTPGSDYNYNHGLRGFLGGIYAGYNHQFDNGVVLGVEADAWFGDVHGSSHAPGDDEFRAKTKIDRAISARARLGFAVDRLMPYVAGGVTSAHMKFNEHLNASHYASAKKSLIGWNVGVGVEYALTDNVSLRGEYRYTRFSKKDFMTDITDEYSLKSYTHDIRLGVSYRF